ncbi:hypothetical protein AYO41_02915 [Verrucomicrobia bacterium SCGC AG-212-E04]|nr:hypothetical protein AYO41_02915 [Verrucomicrobia bacterium SCGC AG-212-E04]
MGALQRTIAAGKFAAMRVFSMQGAPMFHVERLRAPAREKFRYLHIGKRAFKVDVMSFWSATVLILLAVLSRLAPIWLGDAWPLHFNAVTAVALCGAAYLPSRWGLLLPLGALGVSDVILNLHYGVSLLEPQILVRYACLFAIAGAGRWIARRGWRPLDLIGGSLAASTLFYLVTNSVSWATEPLYPPGVSGWWQALTTGLPGYPPTWTFFRTSLIGDLLFVGLFMGCAWLGARLARPATSPAPAVTLAGK